MEGESLGDRTRSYHVIGLMSGTSGDGVDAALVRIDPSEQGQMRPQVTVRAYETIEYPASFKARLFPLFDAQTAKVDEICAMNVLLAQQFAKAAHRVAEKANISMNKVDLIGSHGQTIHHLPPRSAGDTGSTLQIGEPSVLAELTGVSVVSNFRARDMAVGGQGAPLVPFADWVLLGGAGKRVAVQNIGGIGNVTVLASSDRTDEIVAFDTGPGNMVIDALVRRMSGGTQHMDEDGLIALSAEPDEAWAQQLMLHPYFALQPPKSTGREEFGEAFAQRMWAEGTGRGLTPQKLVATATLFTARSIFDQYKRFILPRGSLDSIVLGGGGARNPALVGMLAGLFFPTPILRHEDLGWPSDAKEAIAFALLAWATWCGIPANVPGATGAAATRVLGSITLV